MMQDAGFERGLLQSDGGRCALHRVVINSRRVMPFKYIVTAGIEGLLNTFLYRSQHEISQNALTGKSTVCETKGSFFDAIGVTVFSERG